jgi:transposase
MARRRHRQHTREFKLAALARMDSAPDVQALARELGIERALLYRWQRHYISGGAAALRNGGRPRPVLMAVPGTGLPAEDKPAPAAAAANPAPPACLAAHDPAAAARRIAELERKIGQQQLELDFFRAALRQVREPRRPTGVPGATASTR